MSDVTIRTAGNGWDRIEIIAVYVDGVLVGEGCRSVSGTYCWVEPLLGDLAKALGATVTNEYEDEE